MQTDLVKLTGKMADVFPFRLVFHPFIFFSYEITTHFALGIRTSDIHTCVVDVAGSIHFYGCLVIAASNWGIEEVCTSFRGK
mmetsp:Transcript_25949/g.51962  ORF Transcript_25949/g.51962 Transcript_25949/m.51962 type:complete len:82 (+) Transcript_25949:2-247(+)